MTFKVPRDAKILEDHDVVTDRATGERREAHRWFVAKKLSLGGLLADGPTSVTVMLGVNDASNCSGRPHGWVAIAFRFAWRNWYLSQKYKTTWGCGPPLCWSEP